MANRDVTTQAFRYPRRDVGTASKMPAHSAAVTPPASKTHAHAHTRTRTRTRTTHARVCACCRLQRSHRACMLETSCVATRSIRSSLFPPSLPPTPPPSLCLPPSLPPSLTPQSPFSLPGRISPPSLPPSPFHWPCWRCGPRFWPPCPGAEKGERERYATASTSAGP